MQEKLEQILYERYPRIFEQRTLSEQETAMCRGIETGDGWFALLDDLCSKLESRTQEAKDPQVIATQIKQKFGKLRFSTDEASTEQMALIEAAEMASLHICELCGNPGQRTEYRRRLSTRCAEHSSDTIKSN